MISIHALREEGDTAIGYRLKGIENFYPRPPRGGRPLLYGVHFVGVNISIHALREEGDCWTPIPIPFTSKFLSTPSARRATLTTART